MEDKKIIEEAIIQADISGLEEDYWKDVAKRAVLLARQDEREQMKNRLLSSGTQMIFDIELQKLKKEDRQKTLREVLEWLEENTYETIPNSKSDIVDGFKEKFKIKERKRQ